MPLRGVFLLTYFWLSVPVCFFRPFYGILMWTVVAFLNPQWFAWDVGNSLPWALVVAIPTIAGFLTFFRGWGPLLAAREVFLLVLLWVWFFVTTIISVNNPLFAHHSADTWYRMQFVSKIFLMTLIAIAIVDSFARLRILVIVAAGCFGFFVFKAFPFIIATGGSFRLYGPEKSMIADNNDFGLALNMTLPLFFFLAQSEPKRWVRWFFGYLSLVSVPAIFCTYSRGALVGLVTMGLLMIVQLKQRFLVVPIIVLGVIIAVSFAPETWKTRMDPTREGAIDGSARSRLNAWTYAWNLTEEYPVAGGGFDTFTPELFQRYAPKARDIHGPHSVYFQILAEHGFIGLFIYLMLTGSCFVTIHRLAKEARSRGDSIVANYANMFRFSLFGFLTSGIFLGRAYFDYFYFIVACIVMLQNVATREWSRADDDRDEMYDELVGHSDGLPVHMALQAP